ncbi:hypothetical protein PR202_gb25495 [Eleusine coracana subsp. coracana]|uniref:Xyloglucan endotransglucosylase/hydrolase n=1 Tax=Eleusine coracana subsp. coracana TaxID=191504 RepID=A0AAV5FP40_ELECO|nr:hypothetical protein QOZ80_8BG0651380 [Eleusine coracana subsp. coracana]GJN36618.1 hypothetical protein PR202_gb25495 [Eleusine coracana subsp. coracana]
MARWSHLASLAIILALLQAASSEHWLNSYFTTDGNVRAAYDASGQQVAMVILNQQSGGGGFNSKKKFLFGHFSIKMKLIPGNSAGTVSCFYLSSGDDQYRDEIDMEFMGNSSGQPVVLNTNVDDKVIRSFKRYADLPFPNSKPMSLHATLWDGSYWATEKGKIPIDWSHAPFTVSYRNYYANACIGGGKCPAGSARWMHRQLSKADWGTISWAKQNYMRYNYCDDGWRFPQGLPGECSRN